MPTRKVIIPKPDELNVPPSNLSGYTILLMGAKGVGKTTASSSFPGNLNLQLEPRRRNVSLRMVGAEEGLIYVPAAKIISGEAEDPWPLFIEYNAAAVADPSVSTITWDSVDIAYQMCFEHVCSTLSVNHPSEIKDDYGNTWNLIKNEFLALIDTIRSSESAGLLFTSHVKEREQEYSEGTSAVSLIGPSCTPACLKILKESCDFWFYYGKDEGKRTLWVRDPDGLLDVSCGFGFLDAQGNEIEKFPIPKGEKAFYPTVQSYFRPKDKPSQPARKKKGVKKKRSRMK